MSHGIGDKPTPMKFTLQVTLALVLLVFASVSKYPVLVVSASLMAIVIALMLLWDLVRE